MIKNNFMRQSEHNNGNLLRRRFMCFEKYEEKNLLIMCVDTIHRHRFCFVCCVCMKSENVTEEQKYLYIT